ncbi:hypothetical protein ABH926_005883 [Catenulispora sp. GP43]|uniref:hypothetical protein n=1 Tax=Catenulispora sp. GP43 TaxID=3156263 RepID=UPI003514F523
MKRISTLVTAVSTGAAAVALVLGPTGLSAAQAATSPGFEVAFQAPSTRLVEVNPAGQATITESAMAQQTSPSLAGLPNGTFDEAFQASDRTLWFSNSVQGGHQVIQPTCSTAPYIVTPGTSPSLAVDKQGIQNFLFSEGGGVTSLEVPVQNQTCSSSPGDIATGTSPSVAALNVGPNEGGFIFVEAWVAGNGVVMVREPGKGTHVAGNGIQAAPGTSPSVAAGLNGTWKLAYQGTDNRLWTVNSAGATAQTLSFLTPGTSPAVAGLADGGFEMAFVAGDGSLWSDLNGNGHQVAGVNVAPGSNAAIAGNSADSWEIAVPRAGDHHLVTVTPGDTVRDTGQVVATNTTPAVTGLFPVASGTTGSAPLTMNEQPTVGGFIPFKGQFPPFGSTQPGKVLSITYPASGFLDSSLLFVKKGHSTAECGNPNSVVVLGEGKTTTPAQLSAIFGTSTPSFSTTNALGAVACFSGPSPTPSFINLTMNVQFN